MATRERIKQMFQAVDSMNAEAFAAFLTEDVIFQFGNAPEVRGRRATRDAVAQFFGSIAGLAHEITGLWQDGDVVTCRLAITYTRQDGRKVSVPCANIFHYRGDLVCDYRIYMDIGPVYA